MPKIGLKTPLTHSDSGDNLYQVNGVAYIEGNLKLIHLRILIVLISHLQAALRFKISRRRPGIKVPESMLPDPGVLSLRGATRTVRVKITEFGLTPRNCGRLRQYLEELIDMPVVFPGYRKEGMIFPELVHSFSGLITDYDFPVYSRTVDISLPETLVRRLLLTEEGFSTYSRSAAFSITNKYTVRIYWLICSWRSKGGFVISLSNFRKILALGRGYDRYENITCKILRPAAEDLEGRFPIWFLYKTYGSGEERNIVFKIRTAVSPEQMKKESQYVWDVCFHLLHSVGANPTILSDIFSKVDYEDLRPFLSKVMDLTTYIKEVRLDARHLTDPVHDKHISDVNAYIRAALNAWFSDWRIRYQDISE